MKLDNYELLNQRVALVKEIFDLTTHINILRDNIEHVHKLDNMPGVFFKVKDVIYILVSKSTNVNCAACVLGLNFDDDKSFTVLFRPLSDNKDKSYYGTNEGKIEALDEFLDYISSNSSGILHELVHVDDKRKGNTEVNVKSVSNDPYEYYNHPAEIRAYTQQNLHIMSSEINDAIENGQITTKQDLTNFVRIYKQYRDIYRKNNITNEFFYWKPAVFKDYLDNLKFVVELLATRLPV